MNSFSILYDKSELIELVKYRLDSILQSENRRRENLENSIKKINVEREEFILKVLNLGAEVSKQNAIKEDLTFKIDLNNEQIEEYKKQTKEYSERKTNLSIEFEQLQANKEYYDRSIEENENKKFNIQLEIIKYDLILREIENIQNELNTGENVITEIELIALENEVERLSSDERLFELQKNNISSNNIDLDLDIKENEEKLKDLEENVRIEKMKLDNIEEELESLENEFREKITCSDEIAQKLKEKNVELSDIKDESTCFRLKTIRKDKEKQLKNEEIGLVDQEFEIIKRELDKFNEKRKNLEFKRGRLRNKLEQTFPHYKSNFQNRLNSSIQSKEENNRQIMELSTKIRQASSIKNENIVIIENARLSNLQAAELEQNRERITANKTQKINELKNILQIGLQLNREKEINDNNHNVLNIQIANNNHNLNESTEHLNSFKCQKPFLESYMNETQENLKNLEKRIEINKNLIENILLNDSKNKKQSIIELDNNYQSIQLLNDLANDVMSNQFSHTTIRR